MSPSRRFAMRNLWVQLHLWLGLTLGAIGALLGLSGCVLVYEHQVDQWLHPNRYALSGTEARLPVAEYARQAQAAMGGNAEAVGIRLPEGDGRPVLVLARAGPKAPNQRLYLDPATGRVVDEARGSDFVGFMLSLHESLALRQFGGREIVGAAGFAMLFSSLSGIYLWWPAGGLRRSAFGFRRGFTLLRNLHYTVGFWGALVLATLSFTGIFLAFPDGSRAAVAAVAEVSRSPRGIAAAESAASAAGPDEAAAIAIAPYPGARLVGVAWPSGPRGAYRITLRERGATRSNFSTFVLVDPRERAIIHSTDQASATNGDAFLVWVRALHQGTAFDGHARPFVFFGGLMPPLLVVTGLYMWLRQRKAKRLAATRAAAAQGMRV